MRCFDLQISVSDVIAYHRQKAQKKAALFREDSTTFEAAHIAQ